MGEPMCPRSIPLDTAVSAAAAPAISAASDQNYGDGHLHADSPSLFDTDDDNGGHSHDDNDDDDDDENDDYNYDYEDDQDDDASLSSCSSATSIVTFVQQPKSDDSNGYDNTNNDASVSMDTCWTDDKHSSYLSFMEATFVKNLYDREYCAPDLCGQAPHRLDMDEENSAESRFHLPTEFKACQNGDWYWRMISKPLIPASTPWALLANPWVKHFRPQSQSGSGNRLVRRFSDQKERELEVQKCTGPLKSTQAGPDAERVVDVQQQERLDSHQSASSRTPVNGSLVQSPLQFAASKLVQTTVSNPRTRKRSLCGDQDERSITRRINGGHVQHCASEGFDQVSYDNNGQLPDGVSSSKQMQKTESPSDGKGVCSLPAIGPSESPASFPDNISVSVHIKENLKKSPLTSKPLCQLNNWGSLGPKRSL